MERSDEKVGHFLQGGWPKQRSGDKNTKSENNTIDQLDLTDNYRTLHPPTTEYTFFSSAHGMFSRIDHVLGHKTSLNKCKRMERNYITHFFQPQHYETRNQLQKEKWEKNKHMETKQYATKKPMGP